MATGPTETLLAEGLGVPLLAYLCAATPSEIEQRLDGRGELPEAAEVVLAEHLVPLAQRIALQKSEHPGIPMVAALDSLAQVLPDVGMSVGSALRNASGGQIPTAALGGPSDEDPVKSKLFRMAIDSYPLLLAPRLVTWYGPHLISLFHHPARAQLDEALAVDERLQALYPDEDPGLGRRGTVFSSLGRGGSVQSVMFAESVISAAWDAASMGIPVPGPRDLLEAINDSVDRIRAAVAGQPCTVRALLVVTGLTTEDGVAIATPWGELRPLTELERSAAPAALEGAVGGTGPDGRSVTVRYEGELVLDTSIEYRLVVSHWNTDAVAPPFPPVDGPNSIRRRIESISLGVLLAVERAAGSLPTVRFAWQLIADPLTNGRHLAWADPRMPSFMPHELTRAECEAVSSWTALVDQGWSPRIDVAVRRVLSAAHTRTDPTDRLVDAVVALENLFGTKEGEPRLRITTAVAWLLEKDTAGRAALQTRLKKLYDDRSDVVHGNPIDVPALGDKANDALVVAIACLRTLFSDRGDVLALPDGSARSLRLMLGG